MPRTAARETKNAPVRLVSITARQSSADMRTNRPSRVIPAFRMTASSGPKLLLGRLDQAGRLVLVGDVGLQARPRCARAR